MKKMCGDDLKDWRKRHRYSQEAIMMELGVHSRQTISTWENSPDELPRILQLALTALEKIPEMRNVSGIRTSAVERRRLKNKRS